MKTTAFFNLYSVSFLSLMLSGAILSADDGFSGFFNKLIGKTESSIKATGCALSTNFTMYELSKELEDIKYINSTPKKVDKFKNLKVKANHKERTISDMYKHEKDCIKSFQLFFDPFNQYVDMILEKPESHDKDSTTPSDLAAKKYASLLEGLRAD